MRLPRDLPGNQLVRCLERLGYETLRQSGSHIRLVSTRMGEEHHVTVPAHKALRIGTLAGIVTDVANYLDRDRDELASEMFG